MRVPNRHFYAAMHAELVREQNEIAELFETADAEQREWLVEQLAASDRAFRRLRQREVQEKGKAVSDLF
jgi:hypothetical protein